MSVRRAIKAIVCTPEPMDGAARYAAEFVKGLRAEGLAVALYCPRNFAYTEEVREAGVAVISAPERDVAPASLIRRLARNFVFAMRSGRSLLRAMAGGETVHFQNPLHFPLGLLEYAAVRIRRGRIVLTAHDPVPHRWRLGKCLRRFEQAMLAVSYRMADRVVVHNAAGRKVLQSSFGVSEERIEVVPHGAVVTAQEVFAHPAFDQLRLLCFGAIRQNKGIHLAIEAVQHLRAEAGLPIALTIRGCLYTAAEAGYWNACLQSISRAPDGIDVQEGFVPDDEIPQLLALHHALILPYMDFFSESGVAALAVAHSRPILTTASGGLGEMLDQLQCGIAIQKPDTASVMKAIEAALRAGPEQLHEMGRRGCTNLLALRSWPLIAKRTAQIYAELQAHGRRNAAKALSSAP